MHLLRAVKPIFRDLLSTILFVSLFWLTNNIYLATAFGIGLGVTQTLWMRLTGRPVGPLQWVSLVLVTVFGTTTIVKHDPFYIMMKPTLVWLAVGAVMLRRDWMAPYLPPIVTENLDETEIVRAGYAYSTLMFVLAVLNLVVLWLATPKFWAVYALLGPTVAQGALLVVFYFCFRKKITARIRQRRAQAATRGA